MKKFILSALLIISALSFGENWYSAKERIENPQHQSASKDTVWYDYTADPEFIYIWTLKNERATYFNLNDFGFEYPVKLNGLSAYLRDSLQTFSYKIYDKDGISVLFEYEQSSSLYGDNDLIFETPIIMTDDFWFSIVPQTDGLPRQATTEVVESDHSYYGSPGDWQPFYKETERYEWLNYVALEAYTDEDIYPPIVRTISGLENFMDYDANILISVQDMSNVISPMTAQYNVGTGWVTFEMATVKGTYNFIGQIPGQPNGTNGLVKFYMEDELGNAQWSNEYTIVWGTEIPLLNEGFENEFPPNGWSLENVGAGFVQGDLEDGAYIHTGRKVAVHWDDSGEQNDWLITFPVTLPADYPTTFSFWQNTYWTYYYTYHQVAVSTDKINWTQIYSPPYIAGDDATSTIYDGLWDKVAISLADWKGQEVYIGFQYQGDYSNQWYIDDVQIVLDDESPEITDISANTALLPTIGAYLNNPMEINIGIYDFTGIKSAVGHYSFDGGTTVTDVVFAKTKADETWSGVLPASPTIKTGYIYFTLEDTGGVIGDSEQYSINFVNDTDSPEITDFSYGDPVFINDIMNLSVTFEDESDIASVLCYFSKDDWVTQTPVSMNPSKMHSYTYDGSIPAETAETFAEVKFIITDNAGNVLNSNPYAVRWLEGSVLFFDDFDGSNPDTGTWFTDGGTWGYVNNDYTSAVTSLHDSPGGNYGDNLFSPVRTKIFDFSTYYGATLFFWAKVDLETGWDFTYLQATSDESTWINLYEFNGEGGDWKFYAVDLGAFALEPSVRLRFRLVSDSNTNFDGMYVDDVTLAVYLKDYSPPLITYSGPEVITATDYIIPRDFTIPVGLDDYKFNVDLKDISDISEVKVVYSVDGGPDQEALPAISSGITGTYEMVIPAQPAGSKVRYKVVAIDNSEYKNPAETKNYSIRFGNFLYYQNGDDYTDYLDMIGNTPQASAQAVAQRITMGPMDTKDHYKADLVAITIDNYISTDSGYPSDPMYVHVWEDAGGKPGKDIIPPIYTVQESTDESSYEITYVDLRPYSDKLSNIEGDVFVGFTSAGDVTNILYEVAANHASVPGYVNFQRSWLGLGDVDALSWSLDPLDVYHISAVTGHYTYVDAPLPPMGLTANKPVVGTVELNWLPNSEADLDHYNVYRGESEGFVPVTPIGTVIATDPTSYTDVSPTGGDAQGYFYYKVTAVDADSNESTPSKELKINPTGIEENLPLTTKLYQNYPNPFNPDTTIKFSIANSSNVKLTVYNSNGQTVANLINENLNSGYYSSKFDGSSLTSGVYYYTLKVNEKIMTQKMIMLK